MTKKLPEDEIDAEKLAKRMIQRAIDDGRLVRLPNGRMTEAAIEDFADQLLAKSARSALERMMREAAADETE